MQIKLVGDDGDFLDAIIIDKTREFGIDYKHSVTEEVQKMIQKAQEAGYR